MSARDLFLVSEALKAIGNVMERWPITDARNPVPALPDTVGQTTRPEDPPFTAELKDALKKLDAYEKIHLEQNKAINTLNSHLRATIDAKSDMRLMLNATFAAFARMSNAAGWPCWLERCAVGMIAGIDTPSGTLARFYDDPEELKWVQWMGERTFEDNAAHAEMLTDAISTETLLAWLKNAPTGVLFEVKAKRGRPPKTPPPPTAEPPASAPLESPAPADEGDPPPAGTDAPSAPEDDEHDPGF